MNAEDIIDLLKANGIDKVSDEYFPNETEMPYAVVLTPNAKTVTPDMGGGLGEKMQRFRIELYTKSKKDPARALFESIILGNICPDGAFDHDEESYGKGRMYMTAIEFDQLITLDYRR